MASIEVGRICIKTAGRNAGKYCVITRKIDNNFVEITGPKKINGIKMKKCNVLHLEATENKLNIKAKATDAIVEKELKKEKLLDKFKERIKFEGNVDDNEKSKSKMVGKKGGRDKS